MTATELSPWWLLLALAVLAARVVMAIERLEGRRTGVSRWPVPPLPDAMQRMQD